MCLEPCTSGGKTDKIKLDKWSNIQITANEWKGLHKFGDIWDRTNWEDSQEERFLHDSCYITLCSLKKYGRILKDSFRN